MIPTGDADLVECRSESVVVRVEPANGAKVTGLLHRPTRREWLTSPPDHVEAAGGGETYGAAVAYGWDECFPNIAAGSELPDHGELWSRPWNVVGAGAADVEVEVAGSRLPYRFRRRIEIDGADVLVSYAVTNVGADAFHALWAMHPLFAVEAGARILLPGVARAAVVESASAPALARGGRVSWPTTPAVDEMPVDLSTYGGRPGFALKLVVEDPPRRVALADPGGRAWLGVERVDDVVRHLGVWLNEAGWPDGPTRLAHVALEPTSGLTDDLAEAVAAGSGWLVEAGGLLEWQIRLRLGSGEEALREWLDCG